MADADTLKVERDGQLSYGTPDRFAQQRKDCAATGHRDMVKYDDGSLRCMACFQFVAARPHGSERGDK